MALNSTRKCCFFIYFVSNFGLILISWGKRSVNDNCCVFWPTNRCSAPRLLVKIICLCVKKSFFLFFHHIRFKNTADTYCTLALNTGRFPWDTWAKMASFVFDMSTSLLPIIKRVFWLKRMSKKISTFYKILQKYWGQLPCLIFKTV